MPRGMLGSVARPLNMVGMDMYLRLERVLSALWFLVVG